MGRVDILVANAGIARSGTLGEDVEDEHWLNVIDVNLNGVFWCCRDFGRHMLKRGKGTVVTVGSMSGFIVNKPQPQAYYNASKAAVHHLTKSLGAEWGERGVRINSVAPTYIETPMTKFAAETPGMLKTWLEMTPMNRMGQPSEIASVILFLASDASSLLTGLGGSGGWRLYLLVGRRFATPEAQSSVGQPVVRGFERSSGPVVPRVIGCLALNRLGVVIPGLRAASRNQKHTQHHRAKTSAAVGVQSEGLYHHVKGL